VDPKTKLQYATWGIISGIVLIEIAHKDLNKLSGRTGIIYYSVVDKQISMQQIRQ